mmetsp:Transcript_115868/g.275349  ORF Transcript_115868/g.275349 Transcript_115868/m.275349 type:complete len:239 (-) Transcript_115868:275-991(-)
MPAGHQRGTLHSSHESRCLPGQLRRPRANRADLRRTSLQLTHVRRLALGCPSTQLAGGSCQPGHRPPRNRPDIPSCQHFRTVLQATTPQAPAAIGCTVAVTLLRMQPVAVPALWRQLPRRPPNVGARLCSSQRSVQWSSDAHAWPEAPPGCDKLPPALPPCGQPPLQVGKPFGPAPLRRTPSPASTAPLPAPPLARGPAPPAAASPGAPPPPAPAPPPWLLRWPPLHAAFSAPAGISF